MVRTFTTLILTIFLAVGPSMPPASAQMIVPKGDAAWWTKPNIQKRIREERDVIITVKNEKNTIYTMTGAGNLRAPRDFTMQTLLAFNELPKVSKYFKKVVHQPELNRVYFLLEAYGYEARLLIKYSVENLPEKTVFHWKVVWGGFQGMIGTIEFSTYKVDKTEAIVASQFDNKEIPLPKIFTSFLLEVVIKEVAKSMRTYIEDKYAKTKG